MPGRAAMGVLREAIAEAMRAKTDESPGIKSKMDDVAEAVAAMKRDLRVFKAWFDIEHFDLIEDVGAGPLEDE